MRACGCKGVCVRVCAFVLGLERTRAREKETGKRERKREREWGRA